MRVLTVFTMLFSFLPLAAYAETMVIQGEEAKKLYEAAKIKAQILAQKDKKFILRSPGGAEDGRVRKMKVKVGEVFFLLNDEEKHVHNVYDRNDKSWVVRKQKAGEVAAIKFSAPGKHKLRCAIHPKMKIEVTVE